MTTSFNDHSKRGTPGETHSHTLCIGCGVCATLCPQQRIQMAFSVKEGFYLPNFGLSQCDTSCGLCEHACPFAPANASTAEVAASLFATAEGVCHDDLLGYYLATFTGYSEAHRPTSASGGLVTALLQSLLRQGEIDGALCVGPEPGSPTLFDFRICRTEADLLACSGSCYQPVEISRALLTIMRTPGTYAVVALPCMAKALRLAATHNPTLASRIKFIIGLTCGQVKSRHFVDYLCQKANCPPNPSTICFRHKTQSRAASNSMFRFMWPNGMIRNIGWVETVVRPWTQRWFTLEACDCCDDVFAESADAAFMDAWLPEYAAETQGRSLVVIRHPALRQQMIAAREAGLLAIQDISPLKVIESQAGAHHQKRTLIGFNTQSSIRSGIRLPAVRIAWTDASLRHRLEAWTKRANRLTTARWAETTLCRMERRLMMISIPWRAMQLGLRIGRRLLRFAPKKLLITKICTYVYE